MKILAIECSATPASVAVTDGEKLLSEIYCNVALTHSQMLLPIIDGALRAAGTNIENIDGFAIANGPGSFTGVRIGISTVKGLSAANGKKIAAVSTLGAMAYTAANFDGIVAAVMDARCKQCYCALFLSENGTLQRISEDAALPVAEFYKLIETEAATRGKKCILVGDGAQMFKETAAQNNENIILSPAAFRYQSARCVAQAAMPLFREGKTISGGELLPLYLRLPQAERELKAKQKAAETAKG